MLFHFPYGQHLQSVRVHVQSFCCSISHEMEAIRIPAYLFPINQQYSYIVLLQKLQIRLQLRIVISGTQKREDNKCLMEYHIKSNIVKSTYLIPDIMIVLVGQQQSHSVVLFYHFIFLAILFCTQGYIVRDGFLQKCQY